VDETTTTDDTGTVGRDPATGGSRALGLLRNPLHVFLVLGVLAGVYLACVVPHFGGVDETAHFYRSYQISTGQFVPEKPAGSQFSGACIPVDVVLSVDRDAFVYYGHLISLQGKHLPADAPGPTAADVKRCAGDPSTGFVSFSTFGSPVPYIPQATAILIARKAGLGADGMLIAGRFAALVVYLLLVALAIKRAPRAKWAFVATGLLPAAIMQASSSISHDAMTTALVLLVVSSALRAADPPEGTRFRNTVIEAVVLGVLLGSCKPGYAAVAVLYLLPLFGHLPDGVRRAQVVRERWPLVLGPIAAVITTAGWNAAVGDLWRTDADYFGIQTRPKVQKHQLVHAPWDFATDMVRTIWNEILGWIKSLADVGPSVTHWGWVIAFLVAAVYVVNALQRDGDEPTAVPIAQRLLAFVAGAGALVVILAGSYVYYTEPGNSVITGLHPRYLVPLTVLVPLIVGPLRFRWANAAKARVPLAALLALVVVFFCVSLTFRMY